MEKNEKYLEYKTKHPEWSDDQIWTAISLDMQTDVVIDGRGEDVSLEDPDIIEEILRGAMAWLEEVLPIIFVKVRNLLEKLLRSIASWVRKGIDYILEYLSINL